MQQLPGTQGRVARCVAITGAAPPSLLAWLFPSGWEGVYSCQPLKQSARRALTWRLLTTPPPSTIHSPRNC
jgi:hypothetical protein